MGILPSPPIVRAALGGAVASGVFGAVPATPAPALLPETHGREIRALE